MTECLSLLLCKQKVQS